MPEEWSSSCLLLRWVSLTCLVLLVILARDGPVVFGGDGSDARGGVPLFAMLLRERRTAGRPVTPVQQVLPDKERNDVPGDRPLETCRIPVCRFHGAAAPRLFVDEHLDGAGHRLANIVNGMAVANRNGMNFGGVVSKRAERRKLTEHGIVFHAVADRFFGVNASRELFFRDEPKFDLSFKSVRGLEEERPTFGRLANIFCPSMQQFLFKVNRTASEYFTPGLRAALRQPLLAQPTAQFAPGLLTAAFHIRRGDLNPKGQYKRRIIPDEYFYGLARRIKGILPRAEMHVWSSTGHSFHQKRPFWNSSSFDGYRSLGMQVHLDVDDKGHREEDLVSSWVHLAKARIFVTSRSHFSYIPAVLNPYCVIYPGYLGIHGELPEWINGEDQDRSSFDREFKDCVARGMVGLT